MSTKMKRISKSFKHITKIFVTAAEVEAGAGRHILEMGPTRFLSVPHSIYGVSSNNNNCCYYRGFIFAIYVAGKEREMQIGYPTDVKHVAHIGWDGPSGSGPSWMNEFKTAPDFSTSPGNLGDRRDSSSINTASRSTQDFKQSSGQQTTSNIVKDIPSPDHLPQVPKKQKRKKIRSTTTSSSSRQPRAAASSTFNEREVTPAIKV